MAEEIRIPLDGTYLPITKFGSGKKNLVILPGISLLGLEGQGAAIAQAYALFSADYTCYLIDRKKILPQGYTVRDMTEDVYRVLQMLSVECADFFGVSQGGMIALQMALEHPQTVRKMILGSAAAKVPPEADTLFRQWERWTAEENIPALNGSFFENVYSEQFRAENREALQGLLHVGTPEDCKRFAVLVRACREFDVYDRLSDITCPVLVIGAAEDRVFNGRTVARALAEKLGCAIYLYGDGYGHAVYDEAPDYKQRMYCFLKQKKT